MTTRIFAGVDLSMIGLALVTATPEAAAKLDWSAIDHVTIGESLSADATQHQRADRLRKLRRAAMAWLARRCVTDVVFEQYPMGSGSLHGIDLVAEMGGTLRDHLLEELEIAATAAPVSSARKLLIGSLSVARLSIAVRDIPAPEVKRMGRQKAAVWAELRRMGCPFDTVDEGDAFVALNFGLYAASLPCLAGVT
jgi:hypothetical protein